MAGALRRTAEVAAAEGWCAAAHGGGGRGGQLVRCGGRQRRLQRPAAAADHGGGCDCGGRLLQGHCGGRRRGPLARMKMPRNGVVQGLKVEAVLAAEAAWEQ